MCQVYARFFIYNPLKQVHIVIITRFTDGETDSERVSHVPEVTEPIGIQIQVCLISVTGLSP